MRFIYVLPLLCTLPGCGFLGLSDDEAAKASDSVIIANHPNSWKPTVWWETTQRRGAGFSRAGFEHVLSTLDESEDSAPSSGPIPLQNPSATGISMPVPVEQAQTAKTYLVFFDFDKADLTPEVSRIISQAADTAKINKATSIALTGYTDAAGPEGYNLSLSLRRANAVKAALVMHGVPADEISVVGKGKSDPLIPTRNGVREAQNRRVLIVLPPPPITEAAPLAPFTQSSSLLQEPGQNTMDWISVYARYCDGQQMSDDDRQIMAQHGGEAHVPAIFDICTPATP